MLLLDPEAAQDSALPERARGDAVGDDVRARTVAREVVRADHFGIGDQKVGQEAGEALGERVDRAPERAPLGAALLDAVDVQDAGRPGGGEQREEEGIGGVYDQRGVESFADRMQAGGERMHRGVEVLGADRRQVHEVRAAVARATRRRALSAPAAGACGSRP